MLNVKLVGNKIEVEGTLNWAASPSFHRECHKLIATLGDAVILDLRDTTQVDSAGICDLLALKAMVLKQGKSFVVLNCSRSLRATLKALNLPL